MRSTGPQLHISSTLTAVMTGLPFGALSLVGMQLDLKQLVQAPLFLLISVTSQLHTPAFQCLLHPSFQALMPPFCRFTVSLAFCKDDPSLKTRRYTGGWHCPLHGSRLWFFPRKVLHVPCTTLLHVSPWTVSLFPLSFCLEEQTPLVGLQSLPL